jgi:hypothetical protein
MLENWSGNGPKWEGDGVLPDQDIRREFSRGLNWWGREEVDLGHFGESFVPRVADRLSFRLVLFCRFEKPRGQPAFQPHQQLARGSSATAIHRARLSIRSTTGQDGQST